MVCKLILGEIFKYVVHNTSYVGGEILNHKHIEENGDIIEMHIWNVPKTIGNPEGISYSLVCIRNKKRLVGYDNENHGTGKSNHHKHVKDRILFYEFIDEWKLTEDFAEDIDKIKRGVIK